MIIEACNINFPGYIIRNNGQIISMRRGHEKKILIGGTTKDGKYKTVFLYVGYTGKRVCITTHRIVALTFIIGNVENKVVDHIDNNRKNNNLSNLRFISQSLNIFRSKKSKSNSGIRGVYYYKKQKRWIARMSKNGKDIKRFFKTKKEAISIRREMEKTF
jgi:hypothetical protein